MEAELTRAQEYINQGAALYGEDKFADARHLEAHRLQKRY